MKGALSPSSLPSNVPCLAVAGVLLRARRAGNPDTYSSGKFHNENLYVSCNLFMEFNVHGSLTKLKKEDFGEQDNFQTQRLRIC